MGAMKDVQEIFFLHTQIKKTPNLKNIIPCQDVIQSVTF